MAEWDVEHSELPKDATGRNVWNFRYRLFTYNNPLLVRILA